MKLISYDETKLIKLGFEKKESTNGINYRLTNPNPLGHIHEIVVNTSSMTVYALKYELRSTVVNRAVVSYQDLSDALRIKNSDTSNSMSNRAALIWAFNLIRHVQKTGAVMFKDSGQ